MPTPMLQSIHHFLFHPDLQQKILIKDATVTFIIILIYVLYTKIFGPLLMRNRKPFKLNKILIAYNFALSAANAFLGTECTLSVIRFWNSRCGFKKSPAYAEFIKDEGVYIWLIFLLKHLELIDTVFFVLRKKYNQVSFLHVFHHSAVVLIWRWVLKNNDLGFYLLLTISINNCIHVIMYLYYGLAAIGPHMQKYLWWKKYLTTMQIIQFAVILAYMLHGFFSGCETLSSAEMVIFITIFSFMILFFNYYVINYYRNAKNK